MSINIFELNIEKNELLPRVLMAAGAVDKRQSLAILSHMLVTIDANKLSLTATDLEIEISAFLACNFPGTAKITVPAKKLIDILRSLDDRSLLHIQSKSDCIIIKAGRGQFKLATLPAEEFPSSQNQAIDLELVLAKQTLIYLLQSTHFAMSQQDVRVFLNGLLLEFDANTITAVATDGHRMAICKVLCETKLSHLRLLLPRKAILEMLRLLNAIAEDTVKIITGSNYFGLIFNAYTFTTKLIESRFPPYKKAIPVDNDKFVLVECEALKRALSRIIILANEKSRAVMLHIHASGITLIANNQEKEEAIESLEATVEGAELKIGINAIYLLDVLNFMPNSLLRLSLSSTDKSMLVESADNKHYQYIIMPMKL